MNKLQTELSFTDDTTFHAIFNQVCSINNVYFLVYMLSTGLFVLMLIQICATNEGLQW